LSDILASLKIKNSAIISHRQPAAATFTRAANFSGTLAAGVIRHGKIHADRLFDPTAALTARRPDRYVGAIVKLIANEHVTGRVKETRHARRAIAPARIAQLTLSMRRTDNFLLMNVSFSTAMRPRGNAVVKASLLPPRGKGEGIRSSRAPSPPLPGQFAD